MRALAIQPGSRRLPVPAGYGRPRKTALLGCLLLAVTTSPAQKARPPQTQLTDLAEVSLEELTETHISVSSFGRKEEDLWKTPAAVFVITQEDIQRSSLATIPELLRLVPGLQVAQIDASTWAVSARGFNSVFAAKLLVLIDGRTVDSEIYSGAHWDEIDLPLEAIERIEVIRGPGAAVWGTNAVNGVINIITKAPRSTSGLLVSGKVSNLVRKLTVGYGGALGERAQYRTFANFTARRPFVSPTGSPSFDGSQTFRSGASVGWEPNRADEIAARLDLYAGNHKQVIVPEITLPVGPSGEAHEAIFGASLVTRWKHTSLHQDTALQFYFDDQARHELAGYARTRTLDFDYQTHRPAGPRHDLVWGAETRFTFNHLDGVVLPTVRPEYRNFLVDGFLQDEIALIPNRLIATIGSKIEDGSLAGFQLQPSARLLWALNQHQSLWTAASRAAVAPSIQDRDTTIPLSLGVEQGLPVTGILAGNPAFKPETVVAFELGYRIALAPSLSLDVASFLNNNLRLQSLSLAEFTFNPNPLPHVQTQLTYKNGFRAKTGGVEAALSWKPRPALTFQASYAWMEDQLKQVDPGLTAIADAWNTPRNSVAVSASWSLSPRWQANSFVYRVGTLPLSGLLLLDPAGEYGAAIVPAYTRLDLHLSRKIGSAILFDAGGTNLLSPRHLEFGGSTGFNIPSEVPRALFLRGRLSF